MNARIISSLCISLLRTAALLAGASALLTSPAHAHSGTITFNGKVTAQTCSINGNSTVPADFAVALPTVSASTLKTPGSTAGRTMFTLQLTACTPMTGNVQAYFESGPTTDATTGNLILDKTNSSAAYVQIGLLNADGTPIKAGFDLANQGTQPVAIDAKGNATLTYGAQYIAVGGAAQGGDATTRVVYTLVYP